MEILFRGLTPAGHWVYGDLVREKGGAYIVADDIYFSVHPHTVGQYTGVTDLNGNKVFEGDIMAPTGGVVTRKQFGWGFKYDGMDNLIVPEYLYAHKVAGNIHEHKHD